MAQSHRTQKDRSVRSANAHATVIVEYDDDIDAGAATLLAVLRRRESEAHSADESAESPTDEERPTAA
jgi:hypothetical protein